MRFCESKKEYKKQLEVFQRETEQYTHGKCSTLGLLHHVLCYLRAHMELCEQPEYRWLYEESMMYLIINQHVYNEADDDWDSLKKAIEKLCDLQIQFHDDIYGDTARKGVERYLQYRTNVWGRKIVMGLKKR